MTWLVAWLPLCGSSLNEMIKLDLGDQDHHLSQAPLEGGYLLSLVVKMAPLGSDGSSQLF